MEKHYLIEIAFKDSFDRNQIEKFVVDELKFQVGDCYPYEYSDGTKVKNKIIDITEVTGIVDFIKNHKFKDSYNEDRPLMEDKNFDDWFECHFSDLILILDEFKRISQ